MKLIENQTFDGERALYGSRDILVKDCCLRRPRRWGKRLQRVRGTCRCSTAFSICAILSGMITDWKSAIPK